MLHQVAANPFQREFKPLLFVDRITDIADIEDTIKYCQLRLSSRTSTPTVLGAFSILAQRAFLWTDNIDYINEAILIVRDRLNMSGIELLSSPAVQVLLTLLCVRSQRYLNEEDLDETMQLFPTVIKRQIP